MRIRNDFFITHNVMVSAVENLQCVKVLSFTNAVLYCPFKRQQTDKSLLARRILLYNRLEKKH